MSGWVKIYRELAEHPMFRGHADWLGGWVWIIMSACWRETQYRFGKETITLERGQFVTTLSRMSEETGLSSKQIRGLMGRLESDSMIATRKGKHGTIITVCNYEKYQSVEEHEGTRKGTPEGTRRAHEGHTKEESEEGKNTQGAGAREREEADLFSANGAEHPETQGAGKGKAKKVTPALFPEFIRREVAQGFIEHRRAIKIPLSVRAVELLANELEKMKSMGVDPNEALDYAISKGWRGVKAHWFSEGFSHRGEETEVGKMLRSMGYQSQ